jgi:hypothetical protein
VKSEGYSSLEAISDGTLETATSRPGKEVAKRRFAFGQGFSETLARHLFRHAKQLAAAQVIR